MSQCRKVCHRSPAAARKWFRKSGGGYDAHNLYQCTKHGDEIVYHYTRQATKPLKQPSEITGMWFDEAADFDAEVWRKLGDRFKK